MGIFNVTTDMDNGSTLVDINSLTESVLLELYFGDGAVAKLQAQFSKFRSKYIGNKTSWSPKINYDADLIKFNRMCEEQFGYSRFCLSVSPTYDYNAYMINIGWLSDDNVADEFFNNLKIYKDNRGFRYDKAAKVSALSNIYFGLIVDETFTDREVFAIMLHEIGHSFTYAVLNRDGIIGRGSCLVNMIRKINGAIQNNLQNDRDFSEERIEQDIQNPNIVQRIKNFISSKSIINGAIHSITQTIKGMRKNIKYYDYTNEKFADTFASMYGYANDLQQALMKFQDIYMDFYKKDNAKIPGNVSTAIKVGLLTTANMLVFLMDIKDEHPDGLTRIKVQIEYLEKELRNTSLDPKMKMDLQRHLDAQKQLLEDYLSSANDPDVYRVYKMYYKKLYDKYGGDIREKYTDNDAMFKTIDQRYGDLAKNESTIKESTICEDFFGSPLNELFGFGKTNPDEESIKKVLNFIDGDSATQGLRKVMNVELYPINKIVKQPIEKEKMYTLGTITAKDDSKITDSFHDYAANLNHRMSNDLKDWKISIKSLPAMYGGKMMMIVLKPGTSVNEQSNDDSP